MSIITNINETEKVTDVFNDIVVLSQDQQRLAKKYRDQINQLQKEYDEYGYEHSRVQGHLTKIETLKSVYDDLMKFFKNAKLDNIPRQPYTLLEKEPLYFIYCTRREMGRLGIITDCYIEPKVEKFFVTLSYKYVENFNDDLLIDNFDQASDMLDDLVANHSEERLDNMKYYKFEYFLGEQQQKLVIPKLPYDYK